MELKRSSTLKSEFLSAKLDKPFTSAYHDILSGNNSFISYEEWEHYYNIYVESAKNNLPNFDYLKNGFIIITIADNVKDVSENEDFKNKLNSLKKFLQEFKLHQQLNGSVELYVDEIYDHVSKKYSI